MDKLITAIGWEYLRTKALVLEDGGENLIQRQKGFQFINPTEDWFPGIWMMKFKKGKKSFGIENRLCHTVSMIFIEILPYLSRKF